MAKNRKYLELEYAWKEWRRVSGRQYRDKYLEFIDIQMDGAEALGFQDLSQQWLEHYEAPDFSADIEKVWTEKVEVEGKMLSLKEFYQQFHAYIRGKLRNFYQGQVFCNRNPLILVLLHHICISRME